MRGTFADSTSAQRDNHTAGTASAHAAYILLTCCLQSSIALPVVL